MQFLILKIFHLLCFVAEESLHNQIREINIIKPITTTTIPIIIWNSSLWYLGPERMVMISGARTTAIELAIAMLRAQILPARTPAAIKSVLTPKGIIKKPMIIWLSINILENLTTDSSVISPDSQRLMVSVENNWIKPMMIRSSPHNNKILAIISFRVLFLIQFILSYKIYFNLIFYPKDDTTSNI